MNDFRFSLLSDSRVIEELGKKYENLRINKMMTDLDVAKKGGISVSAIYRLKSGKNISLINLIGILRGLGEIDNIGSLIKSVSSQREINVSKSGQQKRVVKKGAKSKEDFKWGEDK